jgi:hypothetical protein
MSAHLRTRTARMCTNGHPCASARSTAWRTSYHGSLKPPNCRGFKSWWTWGTIGEVVLNIETVLDEARWKETCLYVVHLAFGSIRGALLWARLPFQWNARRTYIMRDSHTRKWETRVIGAHLALGPHALKFQAPCSLLPYLAIFWNCQVLSLFCRPRHYRADATFHPRSWPWTTPLPHPRPQSTPLPRPRPRSTLPPHPWLRVCQRWPQAHHPPSSSPEHDIVDLKHAAAVLDLKPVVINLWSI